jgi:predicted RNase H-like nuclease (RuvC/YqgF family)
MGPNEELNTGMENPDRPQSHSPSRGRRRGGRGRRGGARRSSRPEDRPEQEGPTATLEELAEAQQAHEGDVRDLPAQGEQLLEALEIDVADEARTESAAHPAGESPEREPASATSSPQPQRRSHSPNRPEPRERQPASAASVQHAIDEANRIIDTLRAALEDMEEVLETLELAERQKDADEQEIESLRRALRQMHRSRDPGRGRS